MLERRRTRVRSLLAKLDDEPAAPINTPRIQLVAQFERARSHGARVLQPPTEHEYGERDCTVEDLAGHRWQFTQTLRDVEPEEWGGETVEP